MMLGHGSRSEEKSAVKQQLPPDGRTHEEDSVPSLANTWNLHGTACPRFLMLTGFLSSGAQIYVSYRPLPS